MSFTKESNMMVLLCAPYGGYVGGISRWTEQILNHYKNTQNSLTIEVFSLSRAEGVYSGDSLIKRLFSGIKLYIPLLIKFKSKISSCDIDIVHLTSSASYSLVKDIIMLKTAKHHNKKTFFHLRFGRIPSIYIANNWEKKLLHIAIKLSSRVIVIDQKSYETLIGEGYKNIELLPNPIFNTVLEIISTNKLIKREDRKVLYAGHIVPSKGIYELLKACKNIENVKLRMIGQASKEVKKQLLELAGENNEWLEFSGELNHEETIKEMIASNIFAFPSYTEGFPNVILESMACGCSIVATNVGAIPEMLNNQSELPCGICIEPKNIEQLEKGLSKMLLDKDFAYFCSRNAQKRVKEAYGISIVWKQLVNLWESN